MFHEIASAFFGLLVFIGSLFGIDPAQFRAPVAEPQPLGAALPSGTAVFETSLQSRISSTDTSMMLVANSVRGGGTLSGFQCFTVDEGRTDAEYVCGTVSGNSVTGLTRGVDPQTGTTTNTALKFAHRVGANVKITDFPLLQILRNQANGTETYPGLLRYASGVTPASGGDLTDYEFVTGLAFSGAGVIDATTVARGVAELATACEAASSTPSGGSGVLVIPASLASSTYNSATAPCRIVSTGNDGKIDTNFLSTTTIKSQLIPAFGDGSDGDVTIASPTTLTRDVYYNNLTLTSTLTTAGYRVFVRGVASGAGTITWGTPNSGANGAANVGGAAGTASGSGLFRNAAGAPGGTDNTTGVPGASTSSARNLGSAGGTGGTGGGSGGVGGSSTVASSTNIAVFRASATTGIDFASTSANTGPYIGGGGGGGGGSGKQASNGGGGGGGAASGGVVWLAVNTWAGTFTIAAPGGTGGNGATNNAVVGGGGGGGGGGAAVVIYGTKTWAGVYNLAGGTGGTGVASGSTGATGRAYELFIADLL